jgi:hypothetical protein
MCATSDAAGWALETFGGSELGDARRTARLVQVAGSLARHAGESLLKSCAGDEAAEEGLYRLLRNPAVTPAAIAESGYAATVTRAAGSELLLAVEDSTSLAYGHSVAEELGPTGNRAAAVYQGYIVHSVMLLEGLAGTTLGLVEQQRWVRTRSVHGHKHQRHDRSYEEKESFKWQRAGESMRGRLGEALSARVVSVCDREADITAYLQWQQSVGGRYVVRAAQDRSLCGVEEKLRPSLAAAPVLGSHEVEVPQRGGRAARRAQLTLRALSVRLSGGKTGGPEVGCQALLAQELDAPSEAEPLNWLLLTSESVSTQEEALRVLWMYSRRWRIEEFHKAWKSGTRVEELRARSAANLERAVVLLAFVATRLLQLRESVIPPLGCPQARAMQLKARQCNEMLSETEWRVLYLSVHKQAPPTQAPDAAWACHALAKLGGWIDTQRNGRPGWQVLWVGWCRLAERVDAHLLTLQTYGQM